MSESGLQAAAPTAAAPSAAPSTGPIRLRMWPAVLLVVLQWILMIVPAQIAPGTMFHFMAMVWGPLVCSVGIIVWWLFASGAGRRDKWFVLAFIVAGGVLAVLTGDRSVPMLVILFGVPRVTTLWVLWLAMTQWMRWPARRNGLIAAVLLLWGYYPLIRVEGTDGSINAHTSWR